jgi:hypothetical protein
MVSGENLPAAGWWKFLIEKDRPLPGLLGAGVIGLARAASGGPVGPIYRF